MWAPCRLYSQNFEDLYLYQLFSSIDTGFYIDAGAWHPDNDSVTKIFYDQGWRGVNIDPLIESIHLFAEARSEDINLNLAVASPSDPEYMTLEVKAEDPLQNGQHLIVDDDSTNSNSVLSDVRQVKIGSLYDIIQHHAPSRVIHFLKLDVEGFEFRALSGLNLPALTAIQRPRVILFEATLPNSRKSAPHRGTCRSLLEENSYVFLFSDSLNDYFCDSVYYDEYSNKIFPPSVLDTPPIHCSSYFNLQHQLADLSSRFAEMNAQYSAVSAELEALRSVHASVKSEADLTLRQLNQLQEELQHYFLLNKKRSDIIDSYKDMHAKFTHMLLSKSI